VENFIDRSKMQLPYNEIQISKRDRRKKSKEGYIKEKLTGQYLEGDSLLQR